MARIPTLSDAPRVSNRVKVAPTLSPGEAGAGFRQVSQVAGQISDGLMQIRNKQIAEANKVSYTKSNIELTKSFNDLDRELEGAYRESKPNFDGYAEDGMERLNRRRDEILEQAPESARDSINLAFDGKMAQMEQRFRNKETYEKSQYAIFENKNQIKIADQDVYRTPDPIATMSKMNDLAVSIKTSSLFDEKGKAVLYKQIDDLPKSMLDGVIEREDVSEMRKTIDSMDDPALSKVYSRMDPKVVTKARASIERKLKYKEQEGINDVKGKYSDAITGLSMGTLKPTDPEHKQILTKLKNNIVTTMGEDGKELIANMEAYETSSSELKENAFSLNSMDVMGKASSITEDIKDPLSQAATKGRVARIMESQKQSMLKEFKEDPATYITKHDSSVALNAKEMIASKSPRAYNDMINAMDSRYDSMGTPSHQREYISQPIKDHYQAPFKTMLANEDYRGASALIRDFDTMTNGKAYKHFGELDIPKSYAVVSELKDPQDQMNAIKNLMDKDLGKTYELARMGSKIKENDIKMELSSHPILEAMTNQRGGTTEGTEHARAIYDTVYNEYKRLVVTNPNMDHETATKEAWKGFEKRYDVIKGNGYNIPIAKGHNTLNTQNFLDTYTGSASYVKDFDMYLPPKPNGVPTTAEEMDSSIARSGRWVYDRGVEGLTLMVKDDLGKWRPTFKKGEDGKPTPMTLKYEQINSTIYTEKKNAVRERNIANLIKHSRSGRGRDI